ncbi:hypothetical protein [Siminovitchia fortis]|uniref:hypothetical protein n=1 Tax=Siminovitchia fortis TaxID=254758 RepID=UPI001FD1B0EF|nr:hypothetical protein [Siminovitchia fortis]
MKLSEKQLDTIAKAAANAAIEAYENHKNQQEKKKHDRRLRNIKLLLRNYRSFKKHCEDVRLEINILDEKLELEYLDSNEFKIESIKRSKEKTLAMVRYIDKVLTVYKVMCEQSGDPEEIRRYQTIHQFYISDGKMTADEIAAWHTVAKRTVYRDIEKACKALAVLMFGVDGVKFS